MQLNTLNAHTISLNGKHLIEASAGTGKTFNITRLYLRLLLEKGLDVEQILVMTFTKDATEEIRGRIGEILRDSVNRWEDLINEDPFYQHLGSILSIEQAKIKLKKALLYIDEAAIFTLHGFCKRLLSQYAFTSGLSFNVDMDTSGQDLLLEACQDWYRLLAKNSDAQYLLLSQFWPHPASFMQHFSRAIGRDIVLTVKSADEVALEFKTLIHQAMNDLATNSAFITEHLIESKKGSARDTRLTEFNALNAWLSEQYEQALFRHDAASIANFPAQFFHGGRFPKAVKPQLIEIFASTNKVKSELSHLSDKIAKANAFVIVQQGIQTISSLMTDKKNKHKRLTFDDLITTLAALLKQDTSGHLAQLLRQQFPVAMVDEFQDTDNAQFDILKAIYPDDVDNGLYLIGDPKQAIYGFRGGDIFTYLRARHYCQYHWVMDTNWRSTTHMINAYNRLFYGTALSDNGADTFGYDIPYQPVLASPKALEKSSTLSTEHNDDKALQFVYFVGQGDDPQAVVKQHFRPTMAAWCADKIVSLLKNESRSFSAQDIAILVRDGAEADEIKSALQQVGLAGVFLSNRSNLWHSEQAKQLLLVLKAILLVENDRYFVAGLASGLLPFPHQQLLALQADEVKWQSVKFEFLALRDEWLYKGFIAMAIQLLHEHIRVPVADKDRALTNILHLFELLQSASQRYKQPQELIYWFEQQITLELPESEAELRLESDDDLIKIVTQHGSKGLEYPVVFVPFATRYKDPTRVGIRKVNVIDYHNDQGQQCVALGSDSEHIKTMAAEAYAESIRLLYVAVTRAERQCYMLVADFEQSHLSPLGLTLKWQPQQNIEHSLCTLVQDQPDDIGLTKVYDVGVESTDINSTPIEPSVAIPSFLGKIERDWWLSSFTALSKNMRHVGISLPDRDIDVTGGTIEPLVEHASQMRFALTKGAATGNLLHDIFEHTDFSTPHWPQTINRYFDKYPDLLNTWRPEELCQWLHEVVTCELVDGVSFNQIPRDQMAHETEFYFPMVSAKTKSLTTLLSQHRQMNTLDEKEYREVHLPQMHQLKGMMHGFIDLIFEQNGKYYVCDYKSNYLGNDFADYHQSAMQENMEAHYYDLQYLIYALALHRQLKVSIPDYQPEKHFGGVLYCYLRGMSCQSTLEKSGVYLRMIQPDELHALDGIFAGIQG